MSVAENQSKSCRTLLTEVCFLILDLRGHLLCFYWRADFDLLNLLGGGDVVCFPSLEEFGLVHDCALVDDFLLIDGL